METTKVHLEYVIKSREGFNKDYRLSGLREYVKNKGGKIKFRRRIELDLRKFRWIITDTFDIRGTKELTEETENIIKHVYNTNIKLI